MHTHSTKINSVSTRKSTQSDYLRQAVVRARADKEWLKEISVTCPTLFTQICNQLNQNSR